MVSYAEWTGKVMDSATLAVVARVRRRMKEGRDVINFGAGEPDFKTPRLIRDAAHKAIEEGKTRYTPAAGIPELRHAFAERLNALYELGLKWENVVVTAGAKQALYAALRAVCNTGNEVVILTPCWVTYPEMVKLAGGVPVFVRTDQGSSYIVDPDDVGAAITKKTSAIIINTPNNPTGAVYPEEVLQQIVLIARKHDLAIISDEVYDRLILDETLRHTPLYRLAPERVFAAYSCSKTYAMTGWRLGFGVANPLWAKFAGRLLAQSTSNACSVSQYAALEALQNGDEDASRMRRSFVTRRDLICRLLDRSGLPYVKPAGTFFLLLDVGEWLGLKSRGGTEIGDDEKFAEALLEEKDVAVVPGSPFYAPGRVRISFACSEEDIERGVNAIVDFINSLK